MSIASSSKSVRLMVGGVVIALAGAFTLSSLAHAQGRHGGGYGGPGGHEMFMGNARHMERMIDRMLDAVNATDAQRTQVKQIAGAAATDLRSQRESARGLREQSMGLFTQPTVDAAAAEALRQQMLAQHDQSSKRMLQAMLDISRVLTPEQRQQLSERMKQRREMMQRHHRERLQLDAPRQ